MTSIRRTTTINIPFAVGLVVLLALGMPWPSSARAMSLESARRNLRSSQYEGLAVDMMHIDHVDSPYADPQLTMAERMKAAVERSRARARFLEIKRTSPGVSIPEYYGQGEYLVNFSLGTPPQAFRGIADTGSELVWVQCKPDSSPFSEPDPLFDPKQSSSYELVNCSTTTSDNCENCSEQGTCLFEYGYLDGSTNTGDLASETLTLGSASGAPQSFPGFEFGCTHFANGTQEGDGLVGLNQGNDSLVSQLGSQFGHIFSYCLTDFTKATNKTSNLLLGSAGPLPLNYTPLATNPSDPQSYYITVTGISVNGKHIDYPTDTFENGTILDSGTVITRLDSLAYAPLSDRLASLITYPTVDESSNGFDLCYGTANPSFPSVSFHFEGGLEVALPSDNLFIEVEDDVYCLAIQSADYTIFGNIQQQNFQIAIDLAQRRVGFAPTTC